MIGNIFEQILIINSTLWCIATVYCVYAAGIGILNLTIRQFIFSVVIWFIITAIEIALSLGPR